MHLGTNPGGKHLAELKTTATAEVFWNSPPMLVRHRKRMGHACFMKFSSSKAQ